MESMACGVPCVGFKVGGIPEMIDHKKNGYVAEFKNADDLAEGIHWVLERNVPEDGENALGKEAVTKVHRCYSQNTVAMKYINVYDEALAHKHYNL
jgi:glycosyltransferase involved in cell wall biosynthesis